MFTQQDLRAFVTVANHCFRQALDELYQELKITPKGQPFQGAAIFW